MTFRGAASGGGASGLITASNLTMNTARILGRTTASTGAIEELTAGANLTLSVGSLNANVGLGANTFTAKQTITQAAANSGILASTGYSLTGSDTTSMLDYAGTLNTSGSPDVFALRITDTAHGASTTLMNLYAGASGTTSKFKVSAAGGVTLTGGDYVTPGLAFTSTANMISLNQSGLFFTANSQTVMQMNNNYAGLNSTAYLRWSSTGLPNETADIALYRNAAGVLEVNSATAGTFRDLKLRNLIPGATLATTMTDGFVNIPGAAGACTGVPNNTTGYPMYFNATTNTIMVYDGGWLSTVPLT